MVSMKIMLSMVDKIKVYLTLLKYTSRNEKQKRGVFESSIPFECSGNVDTGRDIIHGSTERDGMFCR